MRQNAWINQFVLAQLSSRVSRKFLAVTVVFEDALAVITPAKDMINGSRDIEGAAYGPWFILATLLRHVNFQYP